MIYGISEITGGIHAFDEMSGFNKRQKQLQLREITLEERNAFHNPPLTQDQINVAYIDTAFKTVWNLHEAEYRDRKYFHGFGFGHPVSISSKFATPIFNASTYLLANEDVLKLNRWREACWIMFTTWVAEVGAGTMSYESLASLERITDSLPKVEDFDSKPEPREILLWEGETAPNGTITPFVGTIEIPVNKQYDYLQYAFYGGTEGNAPIFSKRSLQYASVMPDDNIVAYFGNNVQGHSKIDNMVWNGEKLTSFEPSHTGVKRVFGYK